ncbi:hypothetical protein K8R14_02290 [bacterium]|nr:hypothetical protein [bacterium]
MNTIGGKVVVKETGKGISDLLIVVFDLDPKTEPQEVLEICSSGKSLDIWQKISGNRLGSRLTDENGKFELQYDDSQFQVHDRERRPDLALFVLAPEDQSVDPCPKILHVSCGTRYNAGQIEQYVIKLPLEVLRKAGISIHGVPAFALEVPGVDDLLAKMKKLSEEQQKKQVSDKPFSERYKEQQVRLKKALKNAKQPARPPQSFELATPMLFTKKEGTSPEATISYDEESSRLMFKMNKNAEPVPLTFKGARYAKDIENVRGQIKGLSFLVDPEKREILMTLPPRSPNKLALQESEPSELFKWYTKKRRATESAALAAAPADNSPAGTKEKKEVSV